MIDDEDLDCAHGNNDFADIWSNSILDQRLFGLSKAKMMCTSAHFSRQWRSAPVNMLLEVQPCE